MLLEHIGDRDRATRIRDGARDDDPRGEDGHARPRRHRDHRPVHRRHHRQAVTVTTLFHCSDLHFGHPAVPEQYEAIEALIQERKYDVVAISGDVSQRARAGEFQRAREFIRKAEAVSQDDRACPATTTSRGGTRRSASATQTRMYAKYRAYISQDLEPVLRVAGATFVGLNTSQGVIRHTLTWNMRDISIIGHLTRGQIERARARVRASRAPATRASSSCTTIR